MFKLQIIELCHHIMRQKLSNNYSKRAHNTTQLFTLVSHDEGGKGGPNMTSFSKSALSIIVLLSSMAHASCDKRLHTF